MPKGPKEWSPRPADERAATFEDAVRRAFVDVYGPPHDPGYVERSIRSSYLPAGEELGWTKPDPYVVLVLTEFGWVQDPFSGSGEHAKWDRVMDLLAERGKSAWWDSINPGVQVVIGRGM